MKLKIIKSLQNIQEKKEKISGWNLKNKKIKNLNWMMQLKKKNLQIGKGQKIKIRIDTQIYPNKKTALKF